MSDELQDLVEGLAATLRRAVSIDDRRFHLLAYSPLIGHKDPVAAASILHRRSPPEVVEWLESVDLQNTVGYRRVPANPVLDMVARICAPIRWRDLLLGYVWVIDVDPLDEHGVARVVAAAEEAGVILYRERIAAREAQAHTEDLVGTLVFDEQRRGSAADELRTRRLLIPSPEFGVAVVTVWHPDHDDVPESLRVHLVSAVSEVAHRRLPLPGVQVARGDDVVMVFPCRGEPGSATGAQLLEEAVCAALAAEGGGWRPAIGLGEPRCRLADAASAYDEARAAARLARAVPSEGPTAYWATMGAYRSLMALTDCASKAVPIPDVVLRLLRSADADVLVETLETYLELAGNAQAAATALHVHRSSLYNRLRRIEQVAGVDLRSGDDRLELHVGIRLWRLRGSPAAAGDNAGAPMQPAIQRDEWRARVATGTDERVGPSVGPLHLAGDAGGTA